MRLLYLSISYVPSRSASSVHAMKMCAALAVGALETARQRYDLQESAAKLAKLLSPPAPQEPHASASQA